MTSMEEQKLTTFIAFSHENRELFLQVKDSLGTKGLAIHDYDDNFDAGQYLADCTAHWIGKCDRFLLIITESSLNSPWCTMETILALEKAQKTNKRSALFLLHGIDKSKLPQIDLFQDMPIIEMEFESDGTTWKESNVDYVVNTLKEERTIESVLPHGNVAQGQVWSHFFGWFDVMLPELEAKILKNPHYSSTCMPVKYYELIPISGLLRNRLDEVDERISQAGKLESIVAVRAGNRRFIEPDVYKITDGDTDYYCVAGFPATLSVVNQLLEMEHVLTPADAALYITRFYYTLNFLLDHPTVRAKCPKLAQILRYDDEKENPADVLLRAIKRDLKFQTNVAAALQVPSEPESRYLDVYISHTHTNEDRQMAKDMSDYLAQSGLRLLLPDQSDDDENKNPNKILERAVCECRWIIFILSKASMKDPLFNYRNMSLLTNMINERKVSIIPVLVGLEEEDIPDALRWVTYIDTKLVSREHYMQKIEKAIKGETIPMFFDSLVPAGNVALGLAYGYVLNFLNFIVPGFIEYIPDIFEEKGTKDYKCPNIFYLLVPSSLNGTGSLDKHDGITTYGQLKHICKDHCGTTQRKYTFNVSQLTDSTTNEDYYFVGCYPAPIATLWQMEDLKISGLKEDSLRREAANFCDYVLKILKGPYGEEAAKAVRFVHFNDDTTLGMKEALLPQIIHDLEEDRKLKPAT